MDCGGEIIEDLEDSLDDHEKLLELLNDQENLCKLHSAHGLVKTFRCLIMDQEVSLNQLVYKLTEDSTGIQINGDLMGLDLSGNLEDFAEEPRSPFGIWIYPWKC